MMDVMPELAAKPVETSPRPKKLASMPLQSGERTLFIRAHQPAVADHIGGENGGQATLGAFLGHVCRCAYKLRCSKF